MSVNGDIYGQLAVLLAELETALRQLDLWQQQAPSAAQLASQQPFCIDTLNFPQWLQFVFIVRLQRLCETAQPLPQKCDVAPMAETYFGAQVGCFDSIIAAVSAIDRLLSA